MITLSLAVFIFSNAPLFYIKSPNCTPKLALPEKNDSPFLSRLNHGTRFGTSKNLFVVADLSLLKRVFERIFNGLDYLSGLISGKIECTHYHVLYKLRDYRSKKIQTNQVFFQLTKTIPN